MDIEHEIASSKASITEAPMKEAHAFSPPNSSMDSGHIKNSRANSFPCFINENRNKKMESSASVSSSSSDSSLDNLFQVDPLLLRKFSDSPKLHWDDPKSIVRDYCKIDVSIIDSSKSEGSSLQISDLTHESPHTQFKETVKVSEIENRNSKNSSMDSEHENRNRIVPENFVDEGSNGDKKHSKSSSRSSDSSPDDLFQMDLRKSRNSYEKIGLSIGDSSKSEEKKICSQDESLLYIASPTRSPPTQSMERSSSYDLKNIPSSLFAAKLSGPLEWSAASTDSLFSIYIGKNGSARDNISVGGDLYKLRQTSTNSLDLGKSKRMGGNSNSRARRLMDELMKDDWSEIGEDHGVAVDGGVMSSQSIAYPIKKRTQWPRSWCCSIFHCSHCCCSRSLSCCLK